MLRGASVTQLVDIRTVPRSRYNPQFEQTALEVSLPKAGIDYLYMKDLGGLRPKTKHSVNLGWHNASFRNYADYMQTLEFKQALEGLIRLAAKHPTAIMCAEGGPLAVSSLTRRRCIACPRHRSTGYHESHKDNPAYPHLICNYTRRRCYLPCGRIGLTPNFLDQLKKVLKKVHP